MTNPIFRLAQHPSTGIFQNAFTGQLTPATLGQRRAWGREDVDEAEAQLEVRRRNICLLADSFADAMIEPQLPRW